MATEFVGIELELRGEEGVYRDLQRIQSLMNSLGGRKKVDAGLQDARRQVVAYRGELEKLKRTQEQLVKAGYSKVAEGMNADIEAVKNNMKDAQQAIRIFQQGVRESGKTFNQTATAITSRVRQIGGSMQSLGNAMTRLTSPFTRLASGFIMGAGYKALNTMTEGLSKGFSRYDTMKKYPKIMKAFGYSAEQSQKSIDRLDKSVRGLPTGLDEMVDMSQRFTATTGDIEKGTDLAIAANNAFLASMSTDTQRYQGMMQLQDVLGGKDMNAREWNSLVSSMTPAIVKMGESLGYTKDNMDEWIQTVRDGNVANEDFIDTLIKVGTEGGAVAKMAQESKDTWQAFFANVGNAASRMTAGVIKAFDEITQQLYGKDLNSFLAENVIDGIDKLTESAKSWIKANPDKIVDFFDSLKKIDFAGFGRGLLKGFEGVANLIKRFGDIAGGKGLEWLGKGMVYGNMLGRLVSIFGGLTKGFAPVIGKIGALFTKTGRKGLMGALADLVGVGSGAKGAGEAVDDLEDAVPKMGRISTGLDKFFRGWGQVATMIGGSAFVAWGSTKLFKGAFESIKEIGEIIADTDWDHAKWGLIGMGGFLTAFAGLSKLFSGKGGLAALKGGGILAGLTLLFSGTFWADMEMIKRGLKALSESVGMINGIIDEINGIKDVGNINTGKIDNAIQAFNKITRLFNGEAEAKSGQGTLSYGQYGGATRSFEMKKEPLMQFKKGHVNTLKNIKDALGYMKGIARLIDEVNALDFDDKNIQDITTRMGTAIVHISSMFDRIPDSFKSKETENKTIMLKASMENVKKAFNAIVGKGGMFEQFDKFNKQMQNLIKGDKFSKLQTNMDTLSSNLSQIWNKLDFEGQEQEGFNPEQRFGGGGFNKNGGTSQLRSPTSLILEQIQNLALAMTEIEGIIGTIQSISQIKGLQKMLDKVIGDEGIISQLQEMYGSLVDKETGFGQGGDIDIAGIVDGFSKAITSLKESITTLQEIEQIEFSGEGGMSGVVTQITGMVNNLKNAFSEESIGVLTAQIEAFKTNLEKLKTTIESLGSGEGGEGGITVAINIIPDITGDDTTVEELEDAHDAIEDARDAIKELSESIHLTFPISVSLPGLESSIQSMYSAASRLRAARASLSAAGYSTGGLITGGGAQYFASGGSVRARSFPGRPMGTDTVPIWATPGEYMMKKKAVDFFGVNFMRRVNNLDIRGAMNTLMAKAGSMANVGRQTVINNTYNNNQRQTINVNTASSDFVGKISSRFVGAF